MMPNVSYGPMLNSTMTRGASLGSGIRSLLGLGNARNFAGGVSRGINWSSLLNNTSKTLSVVREAIPIVKEVGPMMNNMKSMLKVASVFKDATDVNNEHKSNNNINNNIIKNKKIIFSHYLLEDTSKLYPFEKTNLKEDINLWIKYNNEDITYIVGHLHKSFNENEVDGISEDYIETIDKLTNIIVLDSGGCTIDNNTSYMLIDINKSLKFSKINLTYDYNKFINKELKKEFPDKETILKLFYGINK